ncbi:MAG: serine/threonine-protein kinase [Candidatus Micrarchaeota archaeon]
MQRQRGSGRPPTEDTRAENLARKAAPHKTDQADSLSGSTVSGLNASYSILAPLDAGGMGQVYEALNTATGEKVAIKFILERLTKDLPPDEAKKMEERFFREAKAAASVDHPNVVRTLDIGMADDNAFFVMEFLPGKDLDDVLKKERRIGWETLAPIMMQVCEGVHAAHLKGLIHRDLKPANIKLAEISGQQVVKVLDFGLAKFAHGTEEDLTKTGNIMGTPTYVAPEQVEEAIGKRESYGHEVDIFALGAIMYRVVTGYPPFKGENDLKTMIMRLETRPQMPRELDASLTPEAEAVIMKAMARNPEERHRTAMELRDAIASTLGASPFSGGRPASDDMFLGDILSSMESGRRPIQQVLPPEETPPVQASLAAIHAMEKPRGVFGKLVKATLILAALSGAGYGIYHYRDFIGEKFRELTGAGQSAEQPKPAPSAEQAASEYLVSVESVPTGATVFLVNGSSRDYLGNTPLTKRLAAGEHTLLVRRSGYSPRRITVSEYRASQRVVLSRPAARREAPAPDEAAEDLAPEGTAEPDEPQ